MSTTFVIRESTASPISSGDGGGSVRASEALARFVRDLAGRALQESDVLRQLVESAADVTQADGSCVFERDEDVFRVVAAAGSLSSWNGRSDPRSALPPLLTDCAQSGRAHVTSDAQDDLLLTPGVGTSSIRHAAVAPVWLEGTVSGLMLCVRSSQNGFAASDVEILHRFADHSALVLRGQRLHRQIDDASRVIQRRTDRLEVVARAQQQLTHVVIDNTLPTAIAEAVRHLFPTATCEVFTSGPGGFARVMTTHDGRIGPQRPATEAESSLARETQHTGVSRLAVHLDDGPDWRRGDSEMCAAVRYGNRSAGVLRLRAPSADTFDLQDLDLLTTLARQAGMSVETSRLFSLQDLQRQRAEGAAELARVTLQASNLAVGASDLLRVLDLVVPTIGKAIGVARRRDGLMEFVATSGTLDVLLGTRSTHGHAISSIAARGRPIELSNLQDVTPASVDHSPTDDWSLVVPLVARDHTLGVLIVSAPSTAPLPSRDRVTLEKLSTSLALALDALLLDEDEHLGREREHLLASALTTIDHPIFILDSGGVRYANPAAAREYGWSQIELMEMQFGQLVAEGIPHHTRRITDGNNSAEPGLREAVHRRRDGTEFPALVTFSPLLAQEGDTLGQVVSVRNCTADRLLEQQLRDTEKMIALGGLVAGVAHEINNPLTCISAFAQILLTEPLVGEQRESVELIKQETDRASGVIRDLLIFARKSEQRIGPVDLSDLIDQTLRLRAYPLRNSGIRVVCEGMQALPAVSGDRQTLQQVLINLISNAEDAMSESGERVLTVSTCVTGDHVAMSVRDTGRGMLPDQRRRIFEPFFTTKPSGVGTGLGMSVGFGIVQAHGGDIDVQSVPGVGTTVTVTLPMHQTRADSSDAGPRETLEAHQSPNSLTHE
ncbi:MAG: GAF domain-containing protein [Gemmatimonas sp.]